MSIHMYAYMCQKAESGIKTGRLTQISDGERLSLLHHTPNYMLTICSVKFIQTFFPLKCMQIMPYVCIGKFENEIKTYTISWHFV